jgi:hypothetical protein
MGVVYTLLRLYFACPNPPYTGSDAGPRQSMHMPGSKSRGIRVPDRPMRPGLTTLKTNNLRFILVDYSVWEEECPKCLNCRCACALPHTPLWSEAGRGSLTESSNRRDICKLCIFVESSNGESSKQRANGRKPVVVEQSTFNIFPFAWAVRSLYPRHFATPCPAFIEPMSTIETGAQRIVYP